MLTNVKDKKEQHSILLHQTIKKGQENYVEMYFLVSLVIFVNWTERYKGLEYITAEWKVEK